MGEYSTVLSVEKVYFIWSFETPNAHISMSAWRVSKDKIKYIFSSDRIVETNWKICFVLSDYTKKQTIHGLLAVRLHILPQYSGNVSSHFVSRAIRKHQYPPTHIRMSYLF